MVCLPCCRRRAQSAATPGAAQGAGGAEAPAEPPLEYDDREVDFEREFTSQSRHSNASAFSLEDDDDGDLDDNASTFSKGTNNTLISVQSSFSLEDGGEEPDVADVEYGGSSASERHERRGSPVLINLYDFGNVSGVLNRTVFSSMGMGVFHCAIEVYNLEWSFVYHKGRTRSSGTGVIQNKPQKLKNFNFNQSIEVGWTDWSEEQVKREVRRLSHQWRAKSYHVRRRNCITFAEEFVARLGLGSQFPAWVKKAPELSTSSPALAAVVDSTWGMLAGVESTVAPKCESQDQEVAPLPPPPAAGRARGPEPPAARNRWAPSREPEPYRAQSREPAPAPDDDEEEEMHL